MPVLLAVVALLLSTSSGTTSQTAFERCGETHLTVVNNTSDWVDVIMFEQYQALPPLGSAVFWTDEPVIEDRVMRRRPGQVYHTSITSVFAVQQRACTAEWATL